MGLGFQRDDTFNVFHLEIVAGRLVFRCKLLNNRALCKGYIVFIGRQYLVGVFLGCLLNHLEQRAFHLYTINDKGATKNLVAAVLRVDLSETEDLAVGQRAAHLLLHFMQIFNLFRRQSQAFLLVISLKVFNMLDGLGLMVHSKDVLVQTLIHALKHGVVVGIL